MGKNDMLEELIQITGISGGEELARDMIQSYIMEFVDEIKVNEVGNLYAIKKKNEGAHIAIFAHMDELGLIVCNIDDAGFIKFQKLGVIDDRVLPSSHVEILVDDNKTVPGVIGWLPHFLMSKTDECLKKVVPYQDMFVDVGANSRQEVEEMGIKIGSAIRFKKFISTLANDKIAARGLDNRIGCFILIELIKTLSSNVHFKGVVTAVFTTQKEFDLTGVKTTHFPENPDLAIVLDTISAPDFPSVPSIYKNQFRLGGGPVLIIQDTSTLTREKNTRRVENIAQEKGLPIQRGVSGGHTGACELQQQKEGMNVIPIGIPCRYCHSMGELISLVDVNNTIKLLAAIISSF